MNLYEYVGSKPVVYIDPYGLFYPIPGYPPPPPVASEIESKNKEKLKLKFINWYDSNSDLSWTDSLPDCPCIIVICNNKPQKYGNWSKPTSNLHGYHIGAKWCMRSKSVNGHANQCCYDKDGKLITDGSGIGSADYAPGNWKTFFDHKKHDMDPADWAKELDDGLWGEYNKMYIERRPQVGTEKCPYNPTK